MSKSLFRCPLTIALLRPAFLSLKNFFLSLLTIGLPCCLPVIGRSCGLRRFCARRIGRLIDVSTPLTQRLLTLTELLKAFIGAQFATLTQLVFHMLANILGMCGHCAVLLGSKAIENSRYGRMTYWRGT